MPLEHFRQKKQTIYWIVAIIVIPSFVLAWGVGGAMTTPRGQETRAIIDGKTISRAEFDLFHRRIATVLGKSPQWVLYGNRAGPEYSMLLTYAALEEARKAGIDVTDQEVGTFVSNSPFLAGIDPEDKKAREEAYREFLQKATITHSDFMTGVRDWLTMVKWVTLTDSMPFATTETAYLEHTRRKSTFDYVRLDLRIDDATKNKAMDELVGITEENPDGDEELTNANVEQYLADHPNDRSLWSEATWRFEYILAPFDFYQPDVNEVMLKAHYEANKDNYGKKPFEEVREKVQAKVVEQLRKDFAEATITRELENELRKAIAEGKGTLENILRNERLVEKRGIVGGVSGERPLPTSAFQKTEAFGECRAIQIFLQQLDWLDETNRENTIRELKLYFDTEKPPLSCEKGYVRIRLRDYTPSQARSLRDAEGKVDKQLRNTVLKLMQEERAYEMAKVTAEKMGERLAAEGPEAFEDQVMKFTVGYDKLPDNLRGASLNEPIVTRDYDGWSVLMLTKRNIPTHNDFVTSEPTGRSEDLHSTQMRLRGQHMLLNYGFILAGPRLQTWAIEGMRSDAPNNRGERFQLIQTREEADRAKSQTGS